MQFAIDYHNDDINPANTRIIELRFTVCDHSVDHQFRLPRKTRRELRRSRRSLFGILLHVLQWQSLSNGNFIFNLSIPPRRREMTTNQFLTSIIPHHYSFIFKMCALSGTVFDPSQNRCEYCEFVSPCNSGLSVPTTTTTTTTTTTQSTPSTRPTCPPYDPNVFTCVCSVSSCVLELIPTTTTTPVITTPSRPSCPPFDANIYVCVCGATSCVLELITTTTTSTSTTPAISTPPTPTCPPYDPSVFICVCGASSCILELISTTTSSTTISTRPTCPPYDANVFTCVCGATSCVLELITTTTTTISSSSSSTTISSLTTPFRCTTSGNFPYPGNCYLYYVCAGGSKCMIC